MDNTLCCYIKYTNNYILIFIPEIIYKKKYNLKKYNECYLYKKILKKCHKYIKYNMNNLLIIYSNEKIYTFGYLYDNIFQTSHILVDNKYIDIIINNYKIDRINKVLDIIS